ncbi:alpha/beta hydrolase [Demequina sp. NBRC 110056]|uniref:alpha/beta hydrolase n=1 Tax=Demequina sp. NBRC 110056 TaxID=1570345 RepID=UPI000A04EB7C|nr:alpha/beta hydrolase [Demequina sp. NBRC 110056]
MEPISADAVASEGATRAPLGWVEDVLPGYEAKDLGAPTAYPARADGELARTLVRRVDLPEQVCGVALVVHGYNDYFFGVHLADALADAGCAVYAVDMRRAGRSLREGNQAHHLDHIAELGEDIGDAARAAVADAHERTGADLPLVVHAHSTGALGAAVWAHDAPDPALAGLVLDGPLFGLPMTAWQAAAMRMVPSLARVRPRQVVVPAPSPYTTGLIERGWDFDTRWKSPAGVGATAGWLAATRAARRRVAGGLDIRVPVLVGSADSTGPDRLDNPRHGSQDTVVDVSAIEAYAPGIGEDVELLVVPGAIHDLALSADEPRAVYLEAVRAFVIRVLS